MVYRSSPNPSPVHSRIGEDIDIVRTAQVITPVEIEAVVHMRASKGERNRQLNNMRRELEARYARGDGLDVIPLILEVDTALLIVRGGRDDTDGDDEGPGVGHVG